MTGHRRMSLDSSSWPTCAGVRSIVPLSTAMAPFGLIGVCLDSPLLIRLGVFVASEALETVVGSGAVPEM